VQYDLERFVTAQTAVYRDVVRELTNGRKTSHWMWFIFPQIRGLGRSEMARRYAIASLDEARAYAAHPLLGSRLRECTALAVGVAAGSLVELFGSIDAVKFCSSMTLFAETGEDSAPFREALTRHCDGRPDPATLRILGLADSA
jgi:uncharacterized protein (DUF1810 family)